MSAALGTAVLLVGFISNAASQQGWDAMVAPAAGANAGSKQPRSAQLPPAKQKSVTLPGPQVKGEPEAQAPPTAAPPAKQDLRVIKAGPESADSPAPAAKRDPQPTAEPRGAANAPVPQGNAAATEASLARKYCMGIADSAADARYLLQKKALEAIAQGLEKRVTTLEAKIAEYQEWLAKRDEFSKLAEVNLVRIYSRMRPDAAAAQLVAIDVETAAAVLTKLDPKNASAILNEMDPIHAARLTATISGAAKVAPSPKRAKQPEEKG